MGRPQARLGDATSHGGVIVTGASRTFVNGRPLARLGDLHVCPIPGHGVNPIVTGSPDTITEGRPNARIGLRRGHCHRQPGYDGQLRG